ncbi:MAG: YigZ family protein [Melioribacter sp.]|nr:YigZ family protein [Melioribacter sp.]
MHLIKLPNSIKTLAKNSECKIKEKGSLFIGTCSPINNEEDANAFLAKIRKKYYDATHNCYAYKLVDGTIKYSDGGEPNGTAGLRILNAINHFELCNTIVVVTRYFGGIKLGIGLLGKTYYDTAYRCLSNSPFVLNMLYEKVIITYSCEHLNLIYRLIPKYGAIIEKNIFNEMYKTECYLPAENKEIFISELRSLSNNKVEIENTSILLYR